MTYEEYPADARAHISLQPIAAPSILGLYGFAARPSWSPRTWPAGTATPRRQAISSRSPRSSVGSRSSSPGCGRTRPVTRWRRWRTEPGAPSGSATASSTSCSRRTSSLARRRAMVQPAAVLRWHRQGFRLFWRWRSRPGRPPLPPDLQALIRRMAIPDGLPKEIA